MFNALHFYLLQCLHERTEKSRVRSKHSLISQCASFNIESTRFDKRVKKKATRRRRRRCGDVDGSTTIKGKSRNEKFNKFFHEPCGRLPGRWANEKRLVKCHKIDYLTISDSTAGLFLDVDIFRTSLRRGYVDIRNGSLIAFTCGWSTWAKVWRTHQHTQAFIRSFLFCEKYSSSSDSSSCSMRKEFFWTHRAHLFL